MQSVHESLINDIPLCVTNGTTPALTSLHNTFKDQNFKQYVSNRLVKSSHGALYRDASYNFASEVFELGKDKSDLPQRASCVRLIFDKVWQPWNIQKYKKAAPPTCPHCEAEDSLGHLLRDCPIPTIKNIRKAAMESIRTIGSEGDELTHVIFDAVLEIIHEPDGASIWRALWLPKHIESLRTKLNAAGLAPLEPTGLALDSIRSRAIHSKVLDIAKVLGQGALDMMRERSALFQDALHPTNKPTSGKLVPPPLALYTNQKKFKKKIKQTPVPLLENSRVKSMFPAFVPPPRKHPRVLAQEYQRERELAREALTVALRASRAEQQAAVYAASFIVENDVIQPWDPRAFPYFNQSDNSEQVVRPQHLDREASWQYFCGSMFNQAQRAQIFETAQARDRRIEQLASEERQPDPDPHYTPYRHVFGRKFAKPTRPNNETAQALEDQAQPSPQCSLASSSSTTLLELEPVISARL